MEFYRSYVQPGLPDGDHFRVFGFGVVSDAKVEYSKALKEACKSFAGPKPAPPKHCPRCGTVNAIFTSNICYKVGAAGAWNMICMSCCKVHFPPQPGPTNDALQQIEAIRARDHEAYLEGKAQKAKQRAKARAKPRKEDAEVEAKELGAPFGILNNAVDLLYPQTVPNAGGSKKIKPETQEKNYHMKRSQADEAKAKDAEENPRTVKLVFWAQDQEPLVQQVPVQFEYELFLYEFPFFKNMRGVCAFERYSFEASLWCDLPWNTSPIHVAPEDDEIFIRSWGVRCRGFGRQLDRYQRMHGLALSPATGIRATVNIPPARHNWLVVWGARCTEPEIHLVDLSMAAGLDDDARLALPWAHLIADAPFLLVWRETETGWAAVAPGISSGVLEAPLTLVAHPSAESLMGSGEAIAWLEEWRLGGGPRSRATTPTDSKGGRTKGARPRPASDAVIPRTAKVVHGTRDRARAARPPQGAHPSLTAGEQAAAPNPIAPPAKHKAVPLESLSAANLGVLPPPARVAKEEGLKHESQQAPSRAAARVSQCHGSLALDEDFEIVERPHAPALAASPIEAEGLKRESQADATRVGAQARQPSPPFEDHVKIVGRARAPPPAVPFLKAEARDGPDASKRQASPASEDDVEIVEGPLALQADAVIEDGLKHASGSSGGGQSHKGPVSPGSDVDPESVEARRAPVQPARAVESQELKVESVSPSGAPAPNRSADDDVEIIEAPLAAAHPSCPAKGKEVKLESVSYRGDSAPNRSASLTSEDGDVEFVEAPQAPTQLARADKGKEVKLDYASRGGAPAPKPSDSQTAEDDVMIIDGPTPKEHHRCPPKKSRRSMDHDDDVEIMDGPSAAKRPRLSSTQAMGHSEGATKAARRSPAPSIPDDDIVVIEEPSEALRRLFEAKRNVAVSGTLSKDAVVMATTAKSSANLSRRADASPTAHMSVPVANPTLSSAGADDEVEFVEGSSVVPKRRVSNVNGREFFDLT